MIAERCLAKGYDSLLAGIGQANLSAWLAKHRLEEKGNRVDMLAEIGMAGYDPRPSDPTAFSYHNNHSSAFLTNIETILGYMVGSPSSRCLGILGAGQIDLFGNVNSTLIPGVTFLVGSGGCQRCGRHQSGVHRGDDCGKGSIASKGSLRHVFRRTLYGLWSPMWVSSKSHEAGIRLR